jgi:hypothetical protein
LQEEVIESMLLLQTSLSYMQVWGALHAHPQADVEKGSAEINKMYYDALGMIPYVTVGQSSDDFVMADRNAAIEAYKEMKKRMVKVK